MTLYWDILVSERTEGALWEVLQMVGHVTKIFYDIKRQKTPFLTDYMFLNITIPLIHVPLVRFCFNGYGVESRPPTVRSARNNLYFSVLFHCSFVFWHINFIYFFPFSLYAAWRLVSKGTDISIIRQKFLCAVPNHNVRFLMFLALDGINLLTPSYFYIVGLSD